jgi:hypothetical protein
MVVNNKGQKGQKAKQAAQAKLETKKPAIMSNAAFLYPRARDDGDFVNSGSGATTVKRGYVRRLTEFYNKTPEGATDNPTVLNSLKCLFQFNPDSITRSIQSDTSMQLFFNQEPAQLAQPVPGKAGFAFELLFNREAEVNSGTYLVGGKPEKVDLPNINTEYEFKGAMENFLKEPYNPAWVTKLGVLADIMILDDILGVGLSQDVVNAVFPKEGTASLNLQEDTYEKVDEDDKEKKTTTTAVYDKNRMNSFVQNLGNKAFLVPQPIRVVFSNWMIIEGFVTSSQVTFNKYTRSFIPTQCSVAIQMQALYIGFAQENTFLTDIQKVPTETPGGSDVPAVGTTERELYDQTKAGLRGFLNSAVWRAGQSGFKKVSSFFSKSDPSETLNFYIKTTRAGQAFYEQMVKEAKAAGEATFTFSGELKIWWDSHVTNATNSRTVGLTAATTAGGADLIYASGPPPTVGTINYGQWGTLSSPVIIKIDDHPVYYSERPVVSPPQVSYDALYYGKIANRGEDAVWRWEIADTLLPRPFTQDKFNVELKITTFCTRPGISTLQLPQIIHMRSTVMYDESMKLNPLTVGTLPITQKDRKV